MSNKKSTLKNHKISELKKGKKIVCSKVLTSELLEKSLIFINDSHPVHHKNIWAKKLGFKSKIFPGFAVISIFSSLIGTKLPGIYSVITDLQFSFKKLVYVGDKLVFSCLVDKVYKEFKLAKLDLLVTRKNKKILLGTSTCKILT